MPASPPNAKSSLSLESYLPYRLSVAANAVSRLVAGTYEQRFGLTIPQWRLIANLAEHGALTPNQLSDAAALDKVAVTRAAQALLARNLLERVANDRDARSHRLTLSDAGVRLYDTIAPLAAAIERALLEDWTAEEAASLHELLRRLENKASLLRGLLT